MNKLDSLGQLTLTASQAEYCMGLMAKLMILAMKMMVMRAGDKYRQQIFQYICGRKPSMY